jgi:hypothetical protein
MKIKFYMLGVFLSGSLLAHAQKPEVKCSLLNSYVKGWEESVSMRSFQLGALSRLGYSKDLFFQAETLLSHKGGRNLWEGEAQKVNLAYLDVALLFGIKIHKKWILNGGFQPSVLLLAHNKKTPDHPSASGFVGKSLTRFDYSTLLGLEYLYGDVLSFSLRYNHSFVPFSRYNHPFLANQNILLLRVIQLSAIYKPFLP